MCKETFGVKQLLTTETQEAGDIAFKRAKFLVQAGDTQAHLQYCQFSIQAEEGDGDSKRITTRRIKTVTTELAQRENPFRVAKIGREYIVFWFEFVGQSDDKVPAENFLRYAYKNARGIRDKLATMTPTEEKPEPAMEIEVSALIPLYLGREDRPAIVLDKQENVVGVNPDAKYVFTVRAGRETIAALQFCRVQVETALVLEVTETLSKTGAKWKISESSGEATSVEWFELLRQNGEETNTLELCFQQAEEIKAQMADLEKERPIDIKPGQKMFIRPSLTFSEPADKVFLMETAQSYATETE